MADEEIISELKKIFKKLKDIEELLNTKLNTSSDAITGQSRIRITHD